MIDYSYKFGTWLFIAIFSLAIVFGILFLAYSFCMGKFIGNNRELLEILFMLIAFILADISFICHAIKEVGLSEPTNSSDILDDEAPTDKH
jgi:hypothetical protein